MLSSSTTGLRSTPTPLTSTSKTSPGFIHTGGVRLLPTPPGVPVERTSPGTSSVKVVLYFREDLPLLGGPPSRDELPDTAAHARVLERLQAGACFFSDLLVDVDVAAVELQEALWDLAWCGAVTNDAFAPLRAPRLALAGAVAGGGRSGPAAGAGAGFGAGAGAGFGAGAGAGRTGRRPGRFATRARRRAAPAIQGRWSLTEPLLRGAADPAARRRAVAELLLERYGILTREQVLAEGLPGGFAAIYSELTQLETLGIARRGYFVEGLGGAQFALPGAVERLRSLAGESERERAPIVLSAVDPAQPYGGVLPWPARAGGRRPARTAGAYVVLCEGEPVLYVERGGRALQTLVAGELPPNRGDDNARLNAALAALVEHVHSGAIKRLALEKVDGASAISSPLGPALIAHGFHEGPRRLTLSG